MKYLILILILSFFILSCEENQDVGFGDFKCPKGQTVSVKDGKVTCSCKDGFYLDAEDNCVDPCIGKCSGHGSCTATSLTEITCNCDEDFYVDGIKCIDPCASIDCSGHGTCSATSLTETKCTCDKNYYAKGTKCINPCTGKCNNGTCSATTLNDAICDCKDDFYQTDDLQCKNPCANKCSNHGTCSATTLNDASCNCDKGYKEVSLECIDIDECTDGSAICGINRICINKSGTYECFCGDGFVEDGNNCKAEVTYTQWGTDLSDFSYQMLEDSNGNVYIVGETSANLSGDGNSGGKDILLIKLDNNHEEVWTKQWGTSEDDKGSALALDSDDNIYITGYTKGKLGKKKYGSKDIFLLKVNPFGVKEWVKQWGNDEEDIGYDLTIDIINGIEYIFVLGQIGEENLILADKTDIFLTKFKTDGSKEWTKTWGGDQYDVGRTITIDDNHNIYMAGWTKGDLDGDSRGGKDIVVIKYPNDGLGWTKRWGSSKDDQARSIIFANEEIYLVSYINGTSSKTDISLSHINTEDGSRYWEKKYSISDIEVPRDLVMYDDNLYIIGYTEKNGNDNILLIKSKKSDGSLLLRKDFGLSNDDRATSFFIDNNTVYASGYTKSSLEGTNEGAEDIFFMEYELQ